MVATKYRKVLATIFVASLLTVAAVALKATSGRGDPLFQITDWMVSGTLARNGLDFRILDRESGDESVTYLIVGSDRRSGLPQSLPALGPLTGQYADSIMLWSIRPQARIVVLALPRDIRVHIPQHGDRKLGSALDYGAAELVRAVKSITSLPIHHYVEVNFEGFAGLVDALGGVDLFIENPIRDAKMGLNLPQGHLHLAGHTAVRFARARDVEELHNGRWIMGPEGEFSRIARQQLLLSALVAKFHATHDPATILRVTKNVGSGVIVDSHFTSKDLRGVSKAILASKGNVNPCVCILPTKRQIPDDQAASPFPPQHDGSSVLREVDRPMSSHLLRWFASSAPIHDVPDKSCSSGIR